MLSSTDSAMPEGVSRPPLCALLVASEIYPLAKTGGLADVCGALPKALRQTGIDVRLLMPAYPSALQAVADNLRVDAKLTTVDGLPARLLATTLPGSDLPIWLLDCPQLYQRPGTPYQDAEGDEWSDNALRYGALCHVAAQLACGQIVSSWRADVVHCHDWHTGLVPLLLREQGVARPRSVFTIHNAAFQGNFPLSVAQALRLETNAAVLSGIEYYGQMSFLKCGTVFADKVTTVSPTYARELRTPEYGCGLHGVFQSRAADLVGIMNGIDTEVWNPETDVYLDQTYSVRDKEGKRECKAGLQAGLGLAVDERAPLAISASRLTTQKMADVLLQELPSLMQRHPRLQFALLGCGDHSLERGFEEFARAFPNRAAVEIGYREASAHRLHAGADLLLHGSRFEPCGLTQLYALRYGTIPVVRRVGGLADSIVDVASDSRVGNGFVFEGGTGQALRDAVDRSLRMYANEQDTWYALRDRAMVSNFSWEQSARMYAELFSEIAGVRGQRPQPLAANDEGLANWRFRFNRLPRSMHGERDATSARAQA